MPETNPNEFTEREKFILSYYRSRQLSGSSRLLGYDLMFAIAAIGCVVLAVWREDTGFWFVGFTLLLGRLYYLATEGGRWTKDFQSIFAKYDAMSAIRDRGMNIRANQSWRRCRESIRVLFGRQRRLKLMPKEITSFGAETAPSLHIGRRRAAPVSSYDDMAESI